MSPILSRHQIIALKIANEIYMEFQIEYEKQFINF